MRGMRSKYTILKYPIRELDCVFTSQGKYLFTSRCGKFWKTPDKIYRVEKSFKDWFELTALDVQYRWCPIHDQFLRNDFTFDSV